MEMRAISFNSTEGLIRRVDLIPPERQDIVDGKSVATISTLWYTTLLYNYNMFKTNITTVLDDALKHNYTEASVQWVTSPDLSERFNLAASGICGNTALLDFGNMSYFNLPFTERRDYNFTRFLRSIHRNNNNSFIFGHGIYRRGSTLREIVLNTLFPSTHSPSTNEEMESKNRSQLIYYDLNGHGYCNPKKLTLQKLGCTVQGTYFLCDGSRTDASVLKVCAKEPVLGNAHFSGCKRFIKSMQQALEDIYGSNYFVALGGVYTVNTIYNLPWKHRIIRNDWEGIENINGRFCKVNAPETMITTFNSSTELHPRNLPIPIKLNSCESMHSLSHHSASVNFPITDANNWNEEYEGYFCPATTLYRIDELQ